MKKSILIILFIATFAASAQMVVRRTNGVAFTNNEIIPITSLTAPANNVGFYVQNTSNAPIGVKIRCESITNATGADFELCFGLCYPSVAVGGRYPGGNFNTVQIAANSQSGTGDHFLNNNTGTGQFPMDYVFKFYMIDSAGTEIGNSVTVTYRYNPNLSASSTADLRQIGISVTKNVTSDFVVINSEKTIDLDLIDINGKKISSTIVETGSSNFDVSGFSAGIYFLNFRTSDGQSAVSKIIKN